MHSVLDRPDLGSDHLDSDFDHLSPQAGLEQQVPVSMNASDYTEEDRFFLNDSIFFVVHYFNSRTIQMHVSDCHSTAPSLAEDLHEFKLGSRVPAHIPLTLLPPI